MKSTLHHLATAFLICAVVLFVDGCEDDDGGAGDGWDFGETDQSVVVAAGDSITAGGYGDSTTRYPTILAGLIGKTVVNQGYGGYMSGSGVSVVKSSLGSYNPGYVLIQYGANDIIMGSQGSLISNLRAMVAEAKNNQTLPILGNLLPMTAGHEIFNGGVDSMNPQIEAMAREEGVTVVDLHSIFAGDLTLLSADGLHPNDAGNQKIAEAFASVLQ